MLEPFHFSSEIRVRLPETDAMGIVFHGEFYTYMEVGRVDYLRNLGLTEGIRPIRDFDNVVVRTACNFRSPARFDDPLVIHVRIAEIKQSSFRFEFVIIHKQENRTVADGESIHVALNMKTWEPVIVPEEFRKVVRSYEGDNLKEKDD